MMLHFLVVSRYELLSVVGNAEKKTENIRRKKEQEKRKKEKGNEEQRIFF
jgi:hypothetical protein